MFTDNYAGNQGGGLYCQGAAAVIRGCRFVSNSAGLGGGAYLLGGTPSVADCEFEDNVARGAGGGIATELVSGITIRRSTMTGNSAATGGGLCLTTGPGTVEDCVISGNTASFGGGVVAMSAGTVTVARCEVSSNSALEFGGGFYVSDSPGVTVSACDIFGNGTGVFVQGDPLEPVHAAANWWGDASGPYHPTLNPDGLGDEVTDGVEFDSWSLWPGGEELPTGFAFRSVSPNPFSSLAVVGFSLDTTMDVRLTVHDASGRLVATLLDGPHAAGVDEVLWGGRDDCGAGVASGVYFLRAETGAGDAASRVVLVR